MNILPEKLLKERYRLQLVSLESPLELPGARSTMIDPGVSPMTDLANNLSDTSLGLTPVQDSKRRLSMDSESSDSTPSPKEKLNCSSDTPLTRLASKPKRLLQSSCRFSFGPLPRSDQQENKENIPCGELSSPGKKNCRVSSPKRKYLQKLISPTKQCSLSKSPAKGLKERRNSPAKDRVKWDLGSSPLKLSIPSHRPVFKVLDESEDGNSRDSGYDSQNIEEAVTKKRKPSPGSMEDILLNCSPGKEEGIAPLKSSPDRAEHVIHTDGLDVDCLATIDEDQENESPRFDMTSLLSNKIILPTDLDDKDAFKNPSENEAKSTVVQPFSIAKKFSFNSQKRPTFRRALSMLDRPTSSDFDSPVSRNNDFGLSSRFKRPDPPRDGDSDTLCKRRRFNVDLTSSSTSLEGDRTEKVKPKFYRSHSENELSVMKSCELKEKVENILPDSSRLYALPSLVGGNKHPSLRSISCDTLACLMTGGYDHIVNSFRIVDARYRFEFEGGHIRGAENWQHGEDEEFISAFLPKEPVPCAPSFDPDSGKKRDILIFHCEFSSQRGPDFYMKLRERDRQLNKDVYPGLHYPECYLLHLGYKEFYTRFPDLCAGNYTTMVDPNHEHDLRKMRAKSKSWSGGTIMRTGRMARLHL